MDAFYEELIRVIRDAAIDDDLGFSPAGDTVIITPKEGAWRSVAITTQDGIVTNCEPIFEALFGARENWNERIQAFVDEKPLPPRDLPLLLYPGREEEEEVDARHADFIQRLKDSGILIAKGGLKAAAEKIAWLINMQPETTSKGGAYDIEPKKITWFFDRRWRAHGTKVFTPNLTAYRIWQAIDAYAAQTGNRRFSFADFWSDAITPEPLSPFQEIGREIYTQNLKPIFDRPQNRHFINAEQIMALTEYDLGALSTFLSFPQMAYVKQDGQPLKNLSLDEIKKLPDIVPSEILANLSTVLGCEPEELVSRDQWHRAIGDKPAESLSKKLYHLRKRFKESDLPAESAEILARIRANSTIRGIDDLIEILNARVKAVTPRLSKDFLIRPRNIENMLLNPQPFGARNTGFTSLVCLRVTEAVYEARVSDMAPELSMEELFGIKKDNSSSTPRVALLLEAHNNLIRVLQRPENSYLLTMGSVGRLVGLNLEALNALKGNPQLAYARPETGDEPGAPDATWVKLAEKLGCTVADLVPVDLWKAAIAIMPAEAAATKLGGGDRRSGPEDEELEEGTEDAAGTERRTVGAGQAAAGGDGEDEDIVALLERRFGQDGGRGVVIDAGIVDAPIAPVLVDIFQDAALEIVKAYRALAKKPEMAAGLSLLNRVEGINRKSKKESLGEVAQALTIDSIGDAAEMLEETKATLVAVLAKAKLEITAEHVMASLRIYQSAAQDTARTLLNRHIDHNCDEGDTDAAAQSLGLTAPSAKALRDNLLQAMALELQKGLKAA